MIFFKLEILQMYSISIIKQINLQLYIESQQIVHTRHRNKIN